MTNKKRLAPGDRVTMNSPFMLEADMTDLLEMLAPQTFEVRALDKSNGRLIVKVGNEDTGHGEYAFYDNELDKLKKR